ncbi:hypothetical protein [Paracoccus sp. (in: a-proteobacteria)]|uniref:hypothetical protein n=1 Tax=Paracoccus sp. TaxID=267 RepID=UPI002AFDE8BE|nr:hypothetical protein [Paracoccus sp. (in: a-proteobacteria)]
MAKFTDFIPMQKELRQTKAALEAAHAKIERLTKERDEARAQVAAAYETAAQVADDFAKDYDVMEPGKPDRYASAKTQRAAKGMVRLVRDDIRALTPADAQSALEAYGREKVREGMRMAAKIADQDSSAYHIRSEIRAEMETLK